MSHMRRRLVGALAAAPLALVGLAIGPGAQAATPAPHAAINSAQVAYISGSNTSTLATGGDTYFANTSQTCTPAATSPCTFAATGGSVTFTDRDMASLNAAGTLAGFDTAFLYQICDLSAAGNATALGKINTFLNAGNKVIIYDADGCSPSTNYSAFGNGASLAFATNNPGAQGASSQYTFVEPDDLTKASNGQAALVAGFAPGSDSLGDANVFTTSNGNWCGADSTINTNGVNGWTTAYSKPGVVPAGGLAVYIGEDVRFHAPSVPHDGQVVGNALQVANGGNLPCLHNASSPPPNSLLPTPRTAATTGGVRNILEPSYPILAVVGILGLVVLAATGLELARRRRS